MKMIKNQISYERVLDLLNHPDGEKFLEMLKDVNPPKVTEQLDLIKVYAFKEYYISNKNASYDEIKKFQYECIASYLSRENTLNIPEWLLLKFQK